MFWKRWKKLRTQHNARFEQPRSAMVTPKPFTYSNVVSPGDPDVMLDLEGLKLTAYTILGDDIILELNHGTGWWITSSNQKIVFDDNRAKFNACFPVANPEMTNSYREFFERAHKESQDLRMVGSKSRQWRLSCDFGSVMLPFANHFKSAQ